MSLRNDAPSSRVDASSESALAQAPRPRTAATRFAVHLGLLGAFAASLATVTLITEGIPHLVAGFSFVALVVVHLVQRRHTVGRLVGTLGRIGSWRRRRGRLAWSDVILTLLTVNVLVSGLYDWFSGGQVILHPRALGIPFRDIGWHVPAALVSLAYLTVHVVRRRGRFSRSAIR